MKYNSQGGNMKKIVSIILILIVTAAMAFAQNTNDVKLNSYVNKNNIPIFDPSRLKIRQSYSLSYFSGGGQSGSVGLYMNSIEYSFSDPLKVRLDIGYMHNPSALFSNKSSITNSGVIIPGFSLDWRPSKNFMLSLDYRQVPYYLNGGYNNYLNHDEWEDNK